MFKKAIVAVLCTASTVALADPQRVTLSHENRFPALHQLEVGYEYQQNDFKSMNYETHSAQARYGLLQNLTARIDVPYANIDRDFGGNDDGLGDIKLGFDLLAYEDIFSYPYVIPHLDIGFATGDEDKQLGTGDTSYEFGVSIGTVVYDVLHYIVDFSYADKQEPLAPESDVFKAALSVLWELNERFSLSAEGLFEDFQDSDGHPYLLGGGLSYRWTDNFQTSAFAGAWRNAPLDEDTTLNVKATYQF